MTRLWSGLLHGNSVATFLYFYISIVYALGDGMAKTLYVSDETHKELQLAKIEFGFKSMDEMLSAMLKELKRVKFLKASEIVQKKMAGEGVSLKELMTSGEELEVNFSKGDLKKPDVIVDTSILYSALYKPGVAGRIVDRAIDGECSLYAPDIVREELREI